MKKLVSIATNGTNIVAVGDSGGAIYDSVDGTNWFDRSLPAEVSGFNAVTYGMGKFWAVGKSSDNATFVIYSSIDGEVWTKVDSARPSKQLYGVAYGNGKLVAVGLSGYIYVSDDGVSWEEKTPPAGVETVSFATVTYGDGNFYVGGTNEKMLSSSDGSDWTIAHSGSSGKSISSIKVGSGKVFLAGSAGLVLIGDAFVPLVPVQMPTASPAGGEVEAGTTVTLSSGTAGATIYYTTDGSTPTTNSSEYSDPITVNSAVTIKAIAVKSGMTDSEVMSESYTIAAMPQVATPTANPAGGEVAAGTTVTLSSATAGATIYYTTDESTPTTSSSEYSGPITVNNAVTIKAIAVKSGMTDSAVMSESYTIAAMPQVATPTANPAGGEVEAGTTVTLSSATAGATIYYTTDGSTPTTSSSEYSDPITVNSAVTIKAIAVKSGMTDSAVMSESYTIAAIPQVATPTANPAGGEVEAGTRVTLSSATAGATIYYTTDGNTPTTSSSEYSDPIRVNRAVTIKAIAVKSGMADSAVMSESYTIAAMPQVATPTANPAGGEVEAGTRVTLSSATAGATIYYTTDGSTPTTSSSEYSDPITVNNAVTIKAIAVKSGMTDSTVMSESYTIAAIPQVATPTANPAGGEVEAGTRVTLSSATAGATIYYTTDGNTPTTSSSEYSDPIRVNRAVTIKAIAVKSGMADSAVMSESYTIAAIPQVATPTANPAGGEVAAGTTVTLSSATAGATIYYTTDESTPTTSSSEYSDPITVNNAVTIKAIAVKSGMTDSAVMSESYTIAAIPQVATPTANPAGGEVEAGTTVTLSSATEGATIYYTTDGSTPTTSSSEYSDPIRVNRAVSIKAIAVKSGMTDSTVMSESYTIRIPNVEVTGVESPAPITDLPNGTAKTVVALGLPSWVEVTLSNGASIDTEVDWSVTTADYDPTSKEKQTFAVSGNLVNLPRGITNPQNLTASIQVTVNAAESIDRDIISVTSPAPITGLANGTPKKADALGLPDEVEVTLADNSTLAVSVKWDVSNADYDPESKEAQSFTVTGELVKLPKGVTNSQDLRVSIRVKVKAADEAETPRQIVKVRQPEAIKDVENGTRKNATALGLPEEVRVTLDDDSTISVEVKWDVEDADYNPNSRKKQRFTVKGKLINLPDHVENPENLGASISVTVDAAPRENDRDDDKNDRDNDKGKSGTGGSSSGGSTSSGIKDSTSRVKVEAGNDQSLFEQLEITRKTLEGKQVDEVVFDRQNAKNILQKAKENNKDMIRIRIDDLPGNPADEVIVKVPKNTLELIKEHQVALEVKTGDVIIAIPREIVATLPENELYFRVVPISNRSDRQAVTQRTLDAEAVKLAAGGQQVQVVGKPMIIETNYSNQRTRVTFPLQDVKLPTESGALQAFLATLAVYVDHTDGEKELKTGVIRYDEKGKPVGIEIEITKFSTFTILSLQGKQVHVEHKAFMTGYPNGTFQPNRIMSRAEMAAVIAFFLQETGQQTQAEVATFADVEPSHWAAKAIQLVYSAGLMTGDADGLFHPNATVTRADMATIFAKWKNLETKQGAAFTDVQGHWAATSIAAVAEQGMMKGYADGSFRPNQGVTRAEAAALFNRVTGRGPLVGITKAIWSDVSMTHWAFAEIAEATISHAAMQNADGTEQVTDER
ncbi:chitobiase/beta-hexosaminidase C-terminal domain-containing protein [Brevibacillus ruminantium]|uniref:Chitobiase/beta-hexosaminidase C-terminal domain-containing protein n=1 Tax=Brevibacillus ruminantium TaxID=2950604 RepID=A0ABY4WI90_9BACL|nr:chitobiase/beta-hexosaminidase C-terminal domain-containing protein [Brevibacillus ruminantium]USG65059.1 chitobiase/beta-hexosaminidase C-terminal domain-containing protein [Brevibacillus ruminantium]